MNCEGGSDMDRRGENGDENFSQIFKEENFLCRGKLFNLVEFRGFSGRSFVVSCEWPRSAFGIGGVDSISQSAE